MTATVLDSSALVALAIPDDALHAQAVAISGRLKEEGIPILILSEVISETLNILGKMQGREFALSLGNQLLSDPDIHLLSASQEREQEALTKWKKQRSGVSYTDCVVMAAADESASFEGDKPVIFGFDDVFGKNGYVLPEAA